MMQLDTNLVRHRPYLARVLLELSPNKDDIRSV
jgi:hypothetical protein